MSRDDRDPYLLLGLNRKATASDVSRAYRRAARATHPDSHPSDPAAAERFNAVTDAYETLRDPGRRAAYDRAHPLVRPVAAPRPAVSAAQVRFSADPIGRRPPLRVGPVYLVPPAGPRAAVPYWSPRPW